MQTIHFPIGSSLLLLVLIILLAASADAVRAAEPPEMPAALPTDSYNNSQRVEGWRADLAYLITELPKRHVNAFTRITQEDWLTATVALEQSLPTLDDAQVVVELMRLVNLLGDSHTALDGLSAGGYSIYPLGLYWFSDGIVVLQTTEEYKHLLGARLEQIDGRPVADAVESLAQVIPHENQSQLRSQAPFYMVVAEVLSALKTTDKQSQARFSFSLPSGEKGSLELAAQPPSRDTQYLSALDPAAPQPYYMHNADQFYWQEWLPLSETLYVAYNACREREDLSMADFTRQLLEGLDGMPEKRLVLDLRNNSGGNSALLDPLIDALAQRSEIRERGHLYVLIGRRTFSSAVLNAISLKDKAGALFAGEPSGGKPSHFGEVQTFQLPVSGLTVSYSTKFFDHAGDTRDALVPDLAVEVSSADFLTGRDPVLEAVCAAGR